MIFVCESLSLYTEEFLAACSKRERRSREGIGDEEKLAEINYISSRK